MRLAAMGLLGRPYAADTLIGGPQERERLVVNLAGFDCVTLVEIVLALARSQSPTGFLRELRQTRYRDNRVAWTSRLHYFSDWMTSNQRRGAVQIRTRGKGSRLIDTRLDLIPGLPPRRASFHVVPKRRLPTAQARIDHGAIVAIASVRARLDFFHTGLLFDQADGPTLVHASRRAGEVIAEPLADFLQRNRTRGIAFASPLALQRSPTPRQGASR